VAAGRGFDLRTRKSDGEQFGFSVADGRLQGHVDGVIVAGPEGFAYPALWECKCLGNKSWSDLEKKGLAISKPIYAAQVAIYQAYLELTARAPGDLHGPQRRHDGDLHRGRSL